LYIPIIETETTPMTAIPTNATTKDLTGLIAKAQDMFNAANVTRMLLAGDAALQAQAVCNGLTAMLATSRAALDARKAQNRKLHTKAAGAQTFNGFQNWADNHSDADMGL
jgi:hypothetical protein